MVGAGAGIATGTAAAPIVTETGIGNDAMTAAGLTGTVTETERSEIFALWRLAVKERAWFGQQSVKGQRAKGVDGGMRVAITSV